jgi:hypothetical protein
MQTSEKCILIQRKLSEEVKSAGHIFVVDAVAII